MSGDVAGLEERCLAMSCVREEAAVTAKLFDFEVMRGAEVGEASVRFLMPEAVVCWGRR